MMFYEIRSLVKVHKHELGATHLTLPTTEGNEVRYDCVPAHVSASRVADPKVLDIFSGEVLCDD